LAGNLTLSSIAPERPREKYVVGKKINREK